MLRVAVRFETDVAEAAERLRVIYQDFPKIDPGSLGARGLDARLKSQETGFGVEVQGNESSSHGDLVSAIRALNHKVLHAAMALSRSEFYVHAGVVGLSGGAVVLPGLSMAGKSTLVLALALGGATYLSDEILVFDPASGRISPFPRAPKLRDICVPYFPSLTGRFVGEGEGRFIRGFSEIARVGSSPIPPKAIILPQYAKDGDDELRPITDGEAFLALASSALNFGAHRDQSLDHLGCLREGTDAYRIFWRDPHRSAERIRCVLEGSPA